MDILCININDPAYIFPPIIVILWMLQSVQKLIGVSAVSTTLGSIARSPLERFVSLYVRHYIIALAACTHMCLSRIL